MMHPSRIGPNFSWACEEIPGREEATACLFAAGPLSIPRPRRVSSVPAGARLVSGAASGTSSICHADWSSMWFWHLERRATGLFLVHPARWRAFRLLRNSFVCQWSGKTTPKLVSLPKRPLNRARVAPRPASPRGRWGRRVRVRGPADCAMPARLRMCGAWFWGRRRCRTGASDARRRCRGRQRRSRARASGQWHPGPTRPI